MLVIESFYDKTKYISPEDELIIYDEVTSLFNFWNNLVIKNSNKKRHELKNNEKEELYNVIKQLKDFEFNKNQSIGFQLDKIIVEILIWGAIKSNKRIILDDILQKTKSSMFNYFHHELLVKGYLQLGMEDKATNIISFLFNKEHVAYLFSLSKYNEEKYKNYPMFFKKLKEYKSLINAKLLLQGERIDLKQVGYEELIKLVDQVQKLKKG